MAWSNSKIFRASVADAWDNAVAFDLGSDVPKAALFNNSVTPDQNAARASTAFNTGTWTTGNEVTDATNWVSGGRALSGTSLDSGTSGVVFYDATDLAGGGTVTISGAYGCLVYDDTITTPTADQGLCFNYFGGSQSVTSGTFTIVWHANGILRYTL